jgi:hypothetical protein
LNGRRRSRGNAREQSSVAANKIRYMVLMRMWRFMPGNAETTANATTKPLTTFLKFMRVLSPVLFQRVHWQRQESPAPGHGAADANSSHAGQPPMPDIQPPNRSEIRRIL